MLLSLCILLLTSWWTDGRRSPYFIHQSSLFIWGKCCRSPDNRPSTSIWHRGKRRRSCLTSFSVFVSPISVHCLALLWWTEEKEEEERLSSGIALFPWPSKTCSVINADYYPNLSRRRRGRRCFHRSSQLPNRKTATMKKLFAHHRLFSSSPWWDSSSCSSSLRPRRHLISFEADLPPSTSSYEWACLCCTKLGTVPWFSFFICLSVFPMSGLGFSSVFFRPS